MDVRKESKFATMSSPAMARLDKRLDRYDPALGSPRHGVVLAASELLQRVFPHNWVHARVALGVASLPRRAPVEIELSAHLKDGA